MRIGIDARFYGTRNKGLGRYTMELIKHLEMADHENEYLVFLREANFEEYTPKNKQFTKRLAEYPWYSWREQLLYPCQLIREKLDLVHFPHFNVPLLYFKPFVLTIHDLILLRHPTVRATTLGVLKYTFKFLAYLFVIRAALHRAKEVITFAQFTKRDIITQFPFMAKKSITVMYQACASTLNLSHQNKEKFSALSPYVLYVGNAYPHKNLEKLISAFAAFRKNGFEQWRLILVGGKDYFYDRLEKEVEEKKEAENVIFFGQANEFDLSALYNSASFFIFPSLYEGFGLPPLEAMCHKLPVASSNKSCMPEILGDAAYYFDPTSKNGIINALEQLATNNTLRETFAKKGKDHANQFNWSTLAEQTINIYNRHAT